jgi:5-formyltetrahydrofolate cyclo-ligase
MSDDEIEASRDGVRAQVLARLDAHAAAGRPWRRVFAYEPLRDEPGSIRLLQAMTDRGASVHVPRLLADRDLDWTRWPGSTVVGRDAIALASVVLVPALAVDRSGRRLGRGGGSYDRALARVQVGTEVVALLHRAELLTSVPGEPWDRPVTAVVTPAGWFDVSGPGTPVRG